MPPAVEHDRKPLRRLSPTAKVCFTVSGIAFIACAMGLLVNHMLTGALAIGGTAAVALIYLAMGLMNLDYDQDATEVRIADESAHEADGPRKPENASVRTHRS